MGRTMTTTRIVIVGAGAAGTSAWSTLRTLGFDGDIVVLNGESAAPYNRTAVNKSLLEPVADLSSVRSIVPSDHRSSMLTTRAYRLYPDRQSVALLGGTKLSYDALLIATGARPRRLSTQLGSGALQAGLVTALRTEADATRIRQTLIRVQSTYRRPARVAIAGAGLLGSEAADQLHALNHQVTLIDPADNPLRPLLGKKVASWVNTHHRANLTASYVAQITDVRVQGENLSLGLDSGHRIAADLLIEALGVAPATDWLRGTRTARDGHISVDDRLRVRGVDRIYAAGDLATVAGRATHGHWGSALAQGAHAAHAMLHDLGRHEDPGPFSSTSNFSTRLYGKTINVIGPIRPDHREIVLTGARDPFMAVALTRDGRAIESAVVLGSAKAANRLRPLVQERAPVEVANSTLAPLAPTVMARRQADYGVP